MWSTFHYMNIIHDEGSFVNRPCPATLQMIRGMTWNRGEDSVSADGKVQED